MISRDAKDAAAEEELARRAQETATISPQTGMTMKTNAKYEDREKM